MRLGVIGVGVMGEAIVAAVLRVQVAAVEEIRVANHAVARLKYLHEKFGVDASAENREAAAGAELLILAIKPQDFEQAALELKPGLAKETTVVSIMAGVPIAKITKLLATNAVVRAIPNTPAQIGEGMTVWTATDEVTPAAREAARRVFSALGSEAFVPEERYLDMATAVSGSGPAYVFLFIEALTDAGVHIGLSRELAATLALQTVAGAARYMEATQKHPADLRNQVTSPGGTTAAALRALEMGGFRAAVLEAVIAAHEKSQALGSGAGDSK